jgi:hypothetical protein
LPFLVAAACASAPEIALAQQSPSIEHVEFLEGRAFIDLPHGDMRALEEDSLVIGYSITSGIHRYYFRVLEANSEGDAGELLERMAARRMETASSDVTVNLDRRVCGEHAVVDLSYWMWHPTAKPQGLLLSKDRLFMLENEIVLMSVEGENANVVELAADEFLDSVHYSGALLCTN